jgi:hypothetical protein
MIWILAFLVLAIAMATITYISQEGGIKFQRLYNCWCFAIGRAHLLIADPDGALIQEFMRDIRWTGVQLLWKDHDEPGYVMRILWRWQYREWEIPDWGQ